MERFAPAKVNLFLHVGPPAADGFHPIRSLMAFADVGDMVSVDPTGEGLTIAGPFAAGLAGEAGNLVVRARDALLARSGRRFSFGLTLDKRLPIASGLGGGSSDAAATLVLLRDVLGLDLDDEALMTLAADLGSDTPACVRARPVIATGRGAILERAPLFPDLPAVLVNPGVASPTGQVYRAYDTNVATAGADAPVWPAAIASAADMARFLAGCRNDLQTPAIGLAQQIAATLQVLEQQGETRLARMSGSGATCFALCETAPAAAALAGRLVAEHPTWWVRSCRIAGGQGAQPLHHVRGHRTA